MNTESTGRRGLLHRAGRRGAGNRSTPLRTAHPSTRRRRRVLVIAASLAVAGVIAAGTGELVARHVIRDKLAGQAPALGSDVSVSEPGSLALWDLVNGEIPELVVASDDAAFGRLSQVGVNADLYGIRLGATPTVTSTDAEVSVSTQSIAAAIETAAPSLTVSSVTTNPSAGLVTAAVGPGGIAQLTLKPALSDGKVTFSATSASLLGEALPPSVVGQVNAGLGSGGAAQTYPLALKATALSVTPDGVQVTLRGGPSALAGSS